MNTTQTKGALSISAPSKTPRSDYKQSDCTAQFVERVIASAAASVTDEGQPSGAALLESDVTDVTDVTGVQTSNDGLSAVTPDETDDVTDVTSKPIIPDESKRPCFKVFDDWQPLPDNCKLKPGVWFFSIKHSKGDAPSALVQQWTSGE